MPQLRFALVQDAAGANAFSLATLTAYLGYAGDDVFTMSPGVADPLAMGGAGADRYVLANSSELIVFENGNSAGDTIVATGIGLLRPTSFVGTIDGRHLLAIDTASFQSVVVIDWQQAANRIESIQLADGTYSFAQVQNAVFTSPNFLGNFSWESMNLGYTTAEFNEALSFYGALGTNVRPVVTPTAFSFSLLAGGREMGAQGMFSYADGNGEAALQYQFWDAAGGGFFRVNGNAQASGVGIDVAPSQLAGVTYVSGATAGSETVFVRAYDGKEWSAWANWTMNSAPNRAPTVAPSAATQGVAVGDTVAVSSLFGVNDPEGDAITQYKFWDGGAGGGQIRVNGVAQTPNGEILVSAANLTNTVYAAGATQGTEKLYVQAFDGSSWSHWASWDMQTQRTSNALPVVNAPATRNADAGQWLKLSDIVTVNDFDGDAMVRFELRDGNAAGGSGYLYANGMDQAQGATVTVNAATLASAWVRGGQNLGTDTIEVRAHDGFGWSDWDSFDLVTRLPNRAPVAIPTATTQGVPIGSTVAASSLFSVNDPDGDAMTQYKFWDGGAGGGQIRVNGVAQTPNGEILVSAANLTNTVYAAGATQGTEKLYVQAFDGSSWSHWASWDMQTQRTSNALPVVNAPATRNADAGQWLKLSDIVTVNDFDGDAMVRFELRDGNAAGGSGYLYANGMDQAQGATVTVNAATLASAWVRGGQNLGTDTIEVRAHDGFGWSDWDSFDLVTRLPNRAPVAIPTATTQGVPIGSTVAASSLFSVNDPDGDAMTQYKFWDGGAGGGQIRVNGVAQTPNGEILVSAANLTNTVYAAGATQGTEKLYVQAFDGSSWSHWASWDMQTQRTSNALPVVNAPATRNADAGQWLKLSDIVTVNDFDGDAMVRFELRDGNAAGGSGYLYANGMDQAQGATVTVNAATLASAWVRGGQNLGTDTIEVRAHDGFGWSDWDSFDLVTRLPNRAPVVTPTTATQGLSIGADIDVGALFSTIDADGDLVLRYELWDGGAGAGRFYVHGTAQAPERTIAINSEDLLGTVYRGSATGTETVYVRAWDGAAWSPWANWRMEVFEPIRFGEVIGTRQSDQILATGIDQVYFGMTGNDLLNATHGSEPLLLGGSGDDLYIASLDSVAVIYENGDSGNDRLDFHHSGSPLAFIQIDGRHLLMVDVQTFDTAAIVIDWRVAENRIEFFGLGSDGTHSYDQMVALVAARGAPNVTIEDIGYSVPAWEDMLRFYSARSDELSVNRAPTFALIDRTARAAEAGPEANERIPLSQIITALGDPDLDPIVQIEVTDTGTGGGYLLVNGVVQDAHVPVLLGSLANAYYVAGNAPGTEAIAVRASDGAVWSATSSATLTTVENQAPVVTAFDRTFVGQTNIYANSQLFQASDPDGNALTAYQLRAPSSFAGFGNSDTPTIGDPMTWRPYGFDGSLGFFVGPQTGTFVLSGRVFDGVEWSEWADAEVTLIGDGAGNSFAEARQVTVGVSPQTWHDWLGSQDTVDYYRFTLTDPARVQLDLGGITTSDTVILALLHGSGGYVDGTTLYPYTFVNSASGTVSYELDLAAGSYNVQLTKAGEGTFYDLTLGFAPNAAPVTSGASLAVASLTTVRLSSLFSALDADGDSVVKVQVEVPGTTPVAAFATGAETLEFEGSVWTLPSLGNLAIDVGAHGSAHVLSARAFDGMAWGDWKEITVTGQAGAPALDIAGDTPSAAALLQLGNLSLTDAIGGGDAADYFIFTVGSGQALDLDLDGVAAGGSVQFAIYQNDGGSLGALAAGTTPLIIDDSGFGGVINLAGGTYYGELVPLSGTETLYSLTLGLA